MLTAHLTFISLVLFNPLGMFFSRHVVHWGKKNELTEFLSFFCILFFGLSAFSGVVSFFLLPFIYDDIDLNLYVFLALFTAGTFFSVIYRNALSSVNILLDRYSYVKYLFAAQLVTMPMGCHNIQTFSKAKCVLAICCFTCRNFDFIPIKISQDMVNLI